jgi:tellurium resistance protein TerD
MPVNLSKGGNVSLSKEAPGLRAVHIGLGWDTRLTDGSAFDLDASVFALTDSGKVRSDADFIFYNNKSGANGSIEHQGDNITGQGDGDDEVILVALDRLPADLTRLAFTVTIHDAEARRQNFGMISNAFMRITNQEGGTEIARFDLSEDASTETAMLFGDVYRHNGEWKFKAVGQGFAGGLGPMAQSFGVNI